MTCGLKPVRAAAIWMGCNGRAFIKTTLRHETDGLTTPNIRMEGTGADSLDKLLTDANSRYRQTLDRNKKSPLMKMLQPNIDSRGRALRAAGALFLTIASGASWPHSRVAAAALGSGALFMFFEAARGWCAARACGIKTPL